MLKKITISFLVLLLIQDIQAQLVGDSFEQAKANGKGELVYVYNGVYGFIEKGSDGEVKGLLVDLMNKFEDYVEQKEGIDLTHKYVYVEDGDFQMFMKEVNTADGGVFGLSNVSIKEERKKDYLFSPPYLDNVSLIVTNNSVETLTGYKDISVKFDGMTAFSVASSTYHQRLLDIRTSYLTDLKIVNVSSGIDVMKELSVNKEAFAVLDLNFYLEILHKKYPIKRHPVCDERDEPFGIIMPKGNDWAPLLNAFFNSGYIESTEYSQVIAKNLGNSALKLLVSVKNQ